LKPTTNPARRDAVFCAVFVMLVLAVPFAVGGRPALPAAFQDDAFYYARIARNVARGYGLTFDGLHATSGFHPLWLVVLVPLFAAWSGPLTPLAAALVLQILLAGAAAALTVATLGRVVGRWPAIAGGVVLAAVPRTGASLTGGLEGALTLASVALGLVGSAHGMRGDAGDLERAVQLGDQALEMWVPNTRRADLAELYQPHGNHAAERCE
jgi:hypothetical protein